jgi:hypothetical protein
MAKVRRLGQILTPILVVVLVDGCSTSAAIERRNGPTIVGRIDRSDAHRLYVTGDDDQRYAIERRDVVDIDHPGKIGRVVGGITTGVGGFFLALAPFATDCSSREPGAGPDCWNLRAMAITIGIGYLLVGLPILLRNVSVLARSRAAAEPVGSPPPPQPLPGQWQPR